MRPVLVAALFLTAVPSAHANHRIWESLYVSPGVQIGYGFGQGAFYSVQVSVGNLEYIIDGDYIPAITIGIRKYKDRTMRYADVQFTTGFSGLGFGRVWVTSVAKSEEGPVIKTGRRFKFYAGFVALGSYDSYKLAGKRPVRNLGLFLVLPIVSPWYDSGF